MTRFKRTIYDAQWIQWEGDLEVVKTNRTTTFHINYHPHREDGPAIIDIDGTRMWYIYGLLHREDGPAVIYSDGKCRYFLNGTQLSYQEYIKILSNKSNW